MVKIKTPVTDQKKQVGFFYAIVKDIKAEEAKSAKGNEYTKLTLDLDVSEGRDQKVFFNLPWDSWDQTDGNISLFKQFKEATNLTTEELGETNNYKNKNISIVVGAVKTWDNSQWKTFTTNEGKIALSYGVKAILPYETTDEMINKINETELLTVATARKEIGKPLNQPGFSNVEIDENPTDDENF